MKIILTVFAFLMPFVGLVIYIYIDKKYSLLERKLTQRLVGSTVALWIGWFYTLGNFARAYGYGVVLGIQIILGTWAYRSIKRSRLGLAPRRRGLEYTCLVLVVMLSVAVISLGRVPLVIHEVWIFFAYFYVCEASCTTLTEDTNQQNE